jgi:epoxyqueuosine reductase QueG
VRRSAGDYERTSDYELHPHLGRAHLRPCGPLSAASVRAPVPSGITKRVYRQTSQTTCPWNVKYATLLPAGWPFAPREALAGKDARTLAREILAMDVETYRAAFRGSPMKRGELPAMKRRTAAVVLGNVGSTEDVDVLTRALDEPEPLVREHAAWALAQLGCR